MSDQDSICPFDLLDGAMRDPFLKQAFRKLDNRHRYGIVARVCRSWNQLSITSSSSLKVQVCTRRNEITGKFDAADSFTEWLKRNIGNVTRLDLALYGQKYTETKMLKTITSATQLRSLRIKLSSNCQWGLGGLSALTGLTSLALQSCIFGPSTLSSILELTQLKALDLRSVSFSPLGLRHVDPGECMPHLTNSQVNLTHLTVDNFDGLVDPEEDLPCVRSLTKLVDPDIRSTSIPSGNLIELTEGLPITGVKISLDDAGHVSKFPGG